MKDVMIDIETLSNAENPAIVQIAACYFDRKTGKIGDQFDLKIDVEDACANGTVNGDTLKWWFSQDPKIIAQVMTGTQKTKASLKGLTVFCSNAEAIWSHATFDFPIVTNAMKKLDLTPLKYYHARDLRTLFDIAGMEDKDYPQKSNAHNAMDDCEYQAKCVAVAFSKLGKK